MYTFIKIFLFLLPSFLFSCIWLNGTTIDGKYTNVSGHYTYFIKNIEDRTIENKLEKIKNSYSYKDKTPKEIKEDKAVILILKGKYNQAIKSLLILEKLYPNSYSIASNLGTAYELNSNNQKAIEWISEGIKRNKNSHYNTEWLHLYILKLKLKLATNPKYLQTKRAIPLPSSFTLTSKINIEGNSYTIKEILRAIHYQLRERIIFVKPKDIIVADLFYTYMLIIGQTQSIEEALDVLDITKLYGFSQHKILEDKRVYYQNIIDNPSLLYYVQSHSIEIMSIVIIIGILLLLLLILRFFKWIIKKI